jgi:hypothetical protein
VQAEAVAELMRKTAHRQLGTRVLAAYGAHIGTAVHFS